MEPLMKWLEEHGITGDTILGYAMPVIGALLLLFLGWIVAAWLGRLTSRALRRANLEETLARFFGKMTKWAVIVFVIIGCLGLFGVEMTAFAAVIAAAGLAIGLAFQGTLSNFAAGVMLLMFRPFKVGDVVTVADTTGKIFEIDLFVTYLDTPDNRRFIIPNSSIFGSTIENITHHATRRVDVAVGTEYPADIDQAREVLLRAARGVEGRIDEPEPAAILLELGDSSINWSVRVWAKTVDFFAVKDRLTRAVKYALDEASIGIPFPQMDVHLQKDDAA